MTEDHLKSLEALPTLPRFAREILQVVSDADAPLSQVTAALSKDPGASARVVSAANAAFFKGHQPITSVDDAAVRLGLNRVRVMATTTLLNAQFQPESCPAFEQARFWHAAMSVALSASKLSNYVPLETSSTAAYLAGLLHNIGLLASACAFPHEMDAILSRRAADSDAALEGLEREVLGFDHQQAGAAVLARWELPPAVVTAVAHHADPDYRGDWARLTNLIGASVSWYAGGFEGVPDGRILRGVSESKLTNIGINCRREDEQLRDFAAALSDVA